MSDAKREAQGLEVVAWQDAENPLYTTGEKRQMHGWATDGYPIVELVRLSDATAVIDQLRERVAELEASPLMSPEEARAGINLQRKEIERLRERVAELEALMLAAAPKAEQPPVQELNDEIAWLWEMHGWNVTAHGKHRAIKRHVDTSRPPESTVNSDDFIRLVPLYAAPKPVSDEVPCSTHPDAPHGFNRNASHSEDRYVCDCEGWQPPVQEPVATVTIQHFRQDPRMENVDFQLQVTLPQGTHKLYAAPQPVSDDAKDALVEGLETIALESTDEQARCCAHHYLAAYRAAQEKK